jgi:hypothetical protein
MLLPGVVASRQIGGEAAPYAAEAVRFLWDGNIATEKCTLLRLSALANATSNYVFTMSLWYYPYNSYYNTPLRLGNVISGFMATQIWDGSQGNWGFRYNAGASTETVVTTDLYAPGTNCINNQWNHYLVSIDLGTGGDDPTAAYVLHNNNLVAMLKGPAWVNGKGRLINWSSRAPIISPEWSWDPHGRLNADVADLWFTNQYLDITQETVRRKFITAGGKPVFLGNNGELPTGASPLVFFSGDRTVWNAGTNKGTGGNFITPYEITANPQTDGNPSGPGLHTDSTKEPVQLP